MGRAFSPSFSSQQPVNEQDQQKLTPPALLKFANQVQSGGAGKEWVGPEGRAREWRRGDMVLGLVFRVSEGMGPQHGHLLRSGMRPLLPCNTRTVRETQRTWS